MIIDIEDYLASINATAYFEHYGTPRKSGRYPYGSGGDEEYGGDKRNKQFLDHVADLRKGGMSEVQIAKALDMTTTQLRAAKSIAKNAQKQEDISFAQALKDKGYSNVAIGQRMGIPESSVRALLAPGVKDKLDVLQTTAGMLKDNVDEKGFIDIGTGVERNLGISRNTLDTAAAVLKEQGYRVHTIQVDQLGTNNKTLVKVLAPPGTEYRDVASNKMAIRQIKEYSDDGGRSYLGILPPLSVDPKRVGVNWDEDGGSMADGVIYVRPGVKDISIGENRYAQVRIKVGDGHYLKGMAVYKDDLPPGTDLLFNTNKKRTDNKLDAMKELKEDEDNPFGATVRQITDRDANGKERVTSAMNIVGSKEGSGVEGGWDQWSRNLPSQFLSKQSTQLAKQQLDMLYENKKGDLDDIMRLTNPTVRKKLLEAYADEVDSSAVHLKAAALPRQSTHVILPVNAMKETEIYAPNFQNGERVALVRFPHGGTFEIPELTVNNNNPAAKKLLGRAQDAVGINYKVAEKLSGADFDGDTVLVIPNNDGKIKSRPALEGLKDFDPKRSYPPYDGMKTMDGGTYNAATGKVDYKGKRPNSRNKGTEMGMVSNLITDMTIMGASDSEIARAVRHSMVVIDAEKHKLDYKRSAEKNGIAALKRKYQEGAAGGASTIISRASGRKDILDRKAGAIDPETGKRIYIDPKTGKKMYTETGEHWYDAKGNIVYKKQRSTKLAETDDAHTLVSRDGGMPMERVYADHSNRLKALGNEARKATLSAQSVPYSPSARKVYDSEVRTLKSKLDVALQNSPRERQAQILGNAIVADKKASYPDMDADTLKKVKAQALTEARLRTNAKKVLVDITPSEWAAIQAGAISTKMLTDILNNSDIEQVKNYATPRDTVLMSDVKTRRAKTMAASGYTQAEIASALGVSLTTLKTAINE